MDQNMSMINGYQNLSTANRKYKDRLFRMVLREKEDLLDLYNAVNLTEYKNPDDLEITTLEDVVYLSVKNDVSFLVGGTMNLYEHQASVNPNMPVRGLLYFARLYEQYAAVHDLNYYSRTLQMLPWPVYVVFYNGTEEEPDETIMRLSTAFERSAARRWPEPEEEGEEPGFSGPSLECVARILNVNFGRNRALMERCHKLQEYAIFVARVRENLAAGADLSTAANQAVDSCIADDILREILVKQRAEVVGVMLHMELEEYQDWVRRNGYKEGHKEGFQEGRQAGRQEGRQEGLQEGMRIVADIAMFRSQGMDDEQIVSELVGKYGIPEEEARRWLRQV